MSASPERALLAALRQTLLADTGVQSAFGAPARIYDERPAEPVFPFAVFGDVQSRAVGASLSEALEHTVNLHVWSRYGGRAEALDSLGALRAALQTGVGSVAGRHVVLCAATFTDVFRDPDGLSTHGLLRLRVITEPQ